MQHKSWGGYPKVNNQVFAFKTLGAMKNFVAKTKGLIAKGNGRSYGDSSLSSNIVETCNLNCFIDFDDESGTLHIQAGVLLSEILTVIVPKGWFLQVTPGTKLITVGGAIASDVHGKNHHVKGCFSESLIDFTLLLPNGKTVTCSKTENSELFRATCGGQGLTGVILEAKLRLKKISSQYLLQTTIKNKNLEQTFSAFEQYSDTPYSVAWIDCMAKGDKLGRSLLTIGDFSHDKDFHYRDKKKINIPFYFPNWLLNSWFVRAFNWLYFNKNINAVSKSKVTIDEFFYPLDALDNWNRMYGKNGFVQYQFILPLETSKEGLTEILEKISDSGKGSFLAVLKLYGEKNENYLSFPLKGYSLALDFKIDDGVFGLLDELDKIVVEYGGRIYLTKDARVSKEVFEQGYSRINEFRELRKKQEMSDKFQSEQSLRVDI